MNIAYQTLSQSSMPLVITTSDLETRDRIDEYLQKNMGLVNELLNKHGALLFRGFNVENAEHFNRFVENFNGQTLDYHGGSVPRSRVTKKVFNATELTRHFKLKLHNELAYQETYPDKIFFYCDKPSVTGGETFIADVRKIYQAIPDTILHMFEERQVKYVRIYQDARPLREKFKEYAFFYQHLTWQDTMQATTREEAEARCKALNMDFKWRANGDLEVWNVLPAIKDHPITGEKLWFNQVLMQNFNPMSYGRLGYLIRRAIYHKDRNMPNNCYFGDGEPIPRVIMKAIFDAGNRNTVAFPWHKGDIMLIDNHSVAHGRNPFSGDRRILVSMIQQPELYSPKSVQLAKTA